MTSLAGLDTFALYPVIGRRPGELDRYRDRCPVLMVQVAAQLPGCSALRRFLRCRRPAVSRGQADLGVSVEQHASCDSGLYPG